MNKFQEISRRILFYFLIISPIIYFPFSKAPLEMGRTFLYGLIISISGIIFLINKKEQILLPNKFILLYFILITLTNTISFDFSRSFFGDYPRFIEGFIPDLIIFLAFTLVLNIFKMLDLTKIIYFSGFGVGIISLIQSLYQTERITGTLGQPNFLGIFSTICIVYILLNWGSKDLKSELFNLGYLLIQFFILIKSASLTSLISLIFIIFYLLFKKQISKKLIYLSLSGIVVLTLLFGNIFIPKIKDIYFQIKDRNQTTISDSLLIRFALWETTLSRSVSSYRTFLIGFGSNYFISEFERNRNSKLDTYSEYNLLFDKPHNYFLEILFSNGVFSLLIFIYLIYLSISKKNQNSIYIGLLSIFIFFNWLDIYLKLILFIFISQNLENISIRNIRYLNLMLFLFLTCVSIWFLSAEIYYYKNQSEIAGKINPFIEEYQTKKEFFYQTKNPRIQINGMKYFSGKELEDYKKFLNNEYPNNLALKLKTNF